MAYYRSEVPNARVLEPSIEVKWNKTSPVPCYSTDESAKIIRTVNGLPHGYRNFSPEVPGLVETSCNVAIMKTEKGLVSILVSVRSNIDAELEAYRRMIGDIGRMGQWDVRLGSAYPGWKPQPGSPFLQFMKKHYQEVLGTQVKIEAIHAGLECGIIGARIPGIQIVSVGPTVKGAHTPDERVKVADVGTMYNLLKNVLRTLPELKA
jgi:dipeptidase D